MIPVSLFILITTLPASKYYFAIQCICFLYNVLQENARRVDIYRLKLMEGRADINLSCYCFYSHHVLYHVMFSTMSCSLPCHVLHHVMFSTMSCSLPCHVDLGDVICLFNFNGRLEQRSEDCNWEKNFCIINPKREGLESWERTLLGTKKILHLTNEKTI